MTDLTVSDMLFLSFFLSSFFFFVFFLRFASLAQWFANPSFFGGCVELHSKIVHYSEILDVDVNPQESYLVLQKLGVVVFLGIRLPFHLALI